MNSLAGTPEIATLIGEPGVSVTRNRVFTTTGVHVRLRYYRHRTVLGTLWCPVILNMAAEFYRM